MVYGGGRCVGAQPVVDDRRDVGRVVGERLIFCYLYSSQRVRKMEGAHRLPLGTQSFESLRSDGERYVDKTHYIELLLVGRFIFFSRPRRFGKSLFLSTLKAYFEGQKALFKGLYIEQAEEDMACR